MLAIQSIHDWYLQDSEQLLAKPACFSWGNEIALTLLSCGAGSCGLCCFGQGLTTGT